MRTEEDAESYFQGWDLRMLEWYVPLRALDMAQRIVPFELE
jgi:hypothetical protein